MKNLLVVDDEKNFLLSLADMFRHYDDQYALFTAYNGLEAIEVLKEEKIDLVVTDLKMPEMDGFGLLAYMTASHQDIPVIVMTAFATPENTNRLDTLGLYQYIEKPIEFDSLHDKIKKALEPQTQGHVAGVSLASFLQLVGLDNKTCTLRITSKDRVGVYYFKDGDLLDAIYGDMSGEEAAIEISGWNSVEIDIEESCRKSEKAIDSPLGFILIEGARRTDERAEAAAREKEVDDKPIAPPIAEKQEEGDVFIDLGEAEDSPQTEQAIQMPDLSETVAEIGSFLRDALGPVSDMILRDTFDDWQKSGHGEIGRLNELIDALCMEIGDSRVEIAFRGAIKPTLLRAGITPPNSVLQSPADSQSTVNFTAEQELSEILPKIKKIFTGTIGPIGDMLMKETVEKWGQQGPLSISRLDELVDLLCTEIDDQDLEHFFRLKIAKLL